jgi:CDP-6-deoxy-D-xylo-4-hexulose-3-dehydrase
MKNSQIIKSRILKLVRQYHNALNKNVFVPGVSLVHYAGRVYDEKELVNLIEASLEFWLSAGRFAQELENRLAHFVGTKYASLVNSGSSANLLAIACLTSPLLKKRQLLAGDEVITTASSFPTTVAPIIQNRLKPVFVDVRLDTLNADVDAIEEAVGKKTKAVFFSHTLGNPFDIYRVIDICRKHNLWLIEDNCDALGARYRGKPTGSFGDISTCSFYPAHQMTTGEGGAVFTSNVTLLKVINSLRDWGRDCWCKSGHDDTCKKRFAGNFGSLSYGYDHKYVYSHLGYNLKITDLQASIGLAQLKKLRKFVLRRQENHEYLFRELEGISSKVILPMKQNYSKPSWFGFSLILKDGSGVSRQEYQKALERKRIQTRLLFAGNILRQPCFARLKSGKDFRCVGNLANTDKLMRDCFWVGVYPGLNRKMLDFMVQEIKRVVGK